MASVNPSRSSVLSSRLSGAAVSAAARKRAQRRLLVRHAVDGHKVLGSGALEHSVQFFHGDIHLAGQLLLCGRAARFFGDLAAEFPGLANLFVDAGGQQGGPSQLVKHGPLIRM